MCSGCNYHPSLIDHTTRPGSLTPTADVAHLGNLNQDSPLHFVFHNGSQGLTSLGCGCHAPADPGPRSSASAASSAPAALTHSIELNS
jgi:hypothetical protein